MASSRSRPVSAHFEAVPPPSQECHAALCEKGAEAPPRHPQRIRNFLIFSTYNTQRIKRTLRDGPALPKEPDFHASPNDTIPSDPLALECRLSGTRVGDVDRRPRSRSARARTSRSSSSSVIETDPLLNAYVSGVADNLWNQVARKDVPYSVKIIKDPQVNSFATMGGFVYVNEGLIDFVQSDDELASVVGHETGHIERRHVITTNSKAQILNILFGIASIFSPLIYEFGGLGRSRPDGQGLARGRDPGRPLRPAADVARRLRSRVDGHDDGAPRGAAGRAQRRRHQVSRRTIPTRRRASRT